MVRFHLKEKAKDGYRVKKIDGLHFVFRGSEHIGNILAPQLGGDKKTASQYKAIAKHWGKTSSHPSKHSAMEWLKNSHGLTVRMESVEEPDLIKEDTTQEYKNALGHVARVSKTVFKNGDEEITSHLPPNHKVSGLQAVRHSTVEKAEQRLKGLGYTKHGEPVNEAEDYKAKLFNMDPKDLKDHFKNLYQQHLKNGMAPRFFKSPQHIAGIIEKQHNVPVGTYSRNVHEGEGELVGTTPRSRMLDHDKRKMVNVVKKDPEKSIKNNVIKNDEVTEAFLRVYFEAKSKIDPDNDGDDDRTDDPVKNPDAAQDKKKGLKMKHIDSVSAEVQLPKTLTGSPGPLIQINPDLNKPYDSPDVQPDQKKKNPAIT